MTALILVIVTWQTAYTDCVGYLAKVDKQSGISALKDVKCPDKSEYDYIIGIPVQFLKEKR